MSMFSRLAKLAASPQGRAAMRQAKGALSDPKNRERLASLRNRFGSRTGSADPPKRDPAPTADPAKAGSYGQTGDLGTGTQGSSNAAAQKEADPPR